MYNITLISTAHSEYGKCNSYELYKIIESINPQVIFEELPSNLLDCAYNENPHPNEPLEVKCIKKYLQNYNIKHIPVDMDLNLFLPTSEIDNMFNSFRKYDVYNKLEIDQYILTEKYGFSYLNSKKCSELFKEKKIIEKNLISFMFNKYQLIHNYKLFHEEQEKRENAMLKNIYNYSKENEYIQAVFLIGSAHRNSVIHKITENEKNEKLQLNWTFYK
ncbi:MAG TPA: hypothetical protein VIV55_02120 [Flavobacterium sp.]